MAQRREADERLKLARLISKAMHQPGDLWADDSSAPTPTQVLDKAQQLFGAK